MTLQTCICVQAVKAAEDAAIQAALAAQQAEAGGNPVDVVAKATLATTRCSQVHSAWSSILTSQFAACGLTRHQVQLRAPTNIALRQPWQAAAPHRVGQRLAGLEPRTGPCLAADNTREPQKDLS